MFPVFSLSSISDEVVSIKARKIERFLARTPLDAARFRLFASFVVSSCQSSFRYASFLFFSLASLSLAAIVLTNHFSFLPALSRLYRTIFRARLCSFPFRSVSTIQKIWPFFFIFLYSRSFVVSSFFRQSPVLSSPKKKRPRWKRGRRTKKSSFRPWSARFHRQSSSPAFHRATNQRKRNLPSVAKHRRRVILLFRSRRMHQRCPVPDSRRTMMSTKLSAKVNFSLLSYRFINERGLPRCSRNKSRVDSDMKRR